ncbi:hypothetical protein R1sor_007165 [Riccia sorocarpa]|uniref:Hydroxyproline O-arabinosyltransferase-like domain-containing protein n=1 Tax=Riccia sorocarpa TaxID=122646 RepID=A0ABD3HVY8_9MARC
MRRVTYPFLIIVALALCIATYNTASMVATYRAKAYSDEDSPDEDSARFFDPLIKMPEHIRQGTKKKRLFHTAVTANDSPYNRWQCRIMYYHYKKLKDMPGSEMGGFTRVLHSGVPDSVMDEIPTVVVNPLPAGEDRGYVVLNRPWAFVQWLQTADIEEDYIFMAEPDHILVKPLPNLATEHLPAAFPFFYIEPQNNEEVLRKFFPKEMGPVSSIDPIGNSPVIIKKSQLMKIAPTWQNISIAMKDDKEADQKFGWVLEMYGYATASALHGVQHILRKDFMLQPPWDTQIGDKYLIHYTYGCDYNMKGELTYGKIGEWRFDKRSYTRSAPPRNLPLPPPGVPETVVTLVKAVNEATANIPNWDESV